MNDRVDYLVSHDGKGGVSAVPIEKFVRIMWISEELVVSEPALLRTLALEQAIPDGYEPVPEEEPELTLLYPGYPIPEHLHQAMTNVGGRVVGSYFEHDEPLTLAVTRYVYRRPQ